MGIDRFPSAKKDLRRAILHKDRGFAVRLTPNGSTSHVKVANLDTDCLAASIPNSSQGFILVEREHLEERIQISDTESSIKISEEAAIRAVEMISLSHFLSLLFSVLNLAKTKPKAALADGFDQFLFRLFLTDVFRHAQGEETRLGHG